MTNIQRDTIASPAEGLIIYNLSSKRPNYFNENSWVDLNGILVAGATQPDAPKSVSASSGNAQADVTFTPPF